MTLDNAIIHGDAIETLRKIPAHTFDFCFADPPYFMQLEEGKKLIRAGGTEFSGCDDAWDKFSSMDAYKQWTKAWLSEVRRTLKENGAICVISGMQSIYEIGSILRELGFWVINDIIWQKSNPTPNFSGARLNNSHETIIWATKSKSSRFTFNYKTGKHLNHGKQMGSIWTLPVCTGKERLRDEKGIKIHNTQKPEALLHRIMVLFTKIGDHVLDPFGGTLTTAAAAKRTGRKFTVIEQDARYIKYGKLRLKNISPDIGDAESAVYDIKPVKVSVAEMVAAGYLKIGETFIHRNGEKAILTDKKGKLKYGKLQASMHEIAAKMMNSNAKRVNAFDYLYVKRARNKIKLSEVRDNYRKHLISEN